MLELSQLYCERDGRALFRNLDAVFEKGTVTQLRGPNGAGKSTLLRIISGLFANFEGKILFNGKSVCDDWQSFHQNMLYVGHKLGLSDQLSVFENLQFLAQTRWPSPSSSADKRCQQIRDAMSSVRLAGYDDIPVSDLSAGQKKRVLMAWLSLDTSPIWLLDELFSAIDLSGVSFLESFLQREADKGRTILFTSHHRPDIAHLQFLDLGVP